MKKLMLDLESLAVESFDTSGERGGAAGAVHGFDSLGPREKEDSVGSCGGTCYEWDCDTVSAGGGEQTCDTGCGGSWYITCGATCEACSGDTCGSYCNFSGAGDCTAYPGCL